MTSVLVVTRRRDQRQPIRCLLEQGGHIAREAATIREALDAVRATPAGIVLAHCETDGGQDGLQVLSRIKAQAPDVPIVFVAHDGSIPEAVDAIRRGAYDYLAQPLDTERFLATMARASRHAATGDERPNPVADAGDLPPRVVAVSPAMQRVLAKVAKFALSRSPVLITGESGTGMELVARMLHRHDSRGNTSFVPVNCGAIPETLIESELFGHSKGAFTGAISDRTGLLAEAHGGVVFLDEIGEMPLQMQVRLLRFLQDGEVRLLGRTAIRHLDVRVVAATNRSLEDEIAARRFREDLYYRIAVLRLHLPPLRERLEDIRALADIHLRRVTVRDGLPIEGFTAAALELLEAHHWPGNVRELHSVVERAAHNAEGRLITEKDVPESVMPHCRTVALPVSQPDSPERAYLRAVMERCRWNHRGAALALGISRTTLWRKLRALGLDSRSSRDTTFQA
jgi:DNA-binding NtrC family response regulator